MSLSTLVSALFVQYYKEEEEEPLDTSLSQPLTPETFVPFMQQHELTLVNFYAPWCIWYATMPLNPAYLGALFVVTAAERSCRCRRLEPVYLEAASKVPTLHFHGHARLAQVPCAPAHGLHSTLRLCAR